MTDNTIQTLRKYQWGVEAAKATGVLTMDTQPTALDTITIGDVTYQWVASGAATGQINRGADLPAAKLNLVAAINGTDLIQDAPNPYVTAAAFISNAMTVTARIPGPAGLAVATTEVFTAVTNIWAATTLTGGAHARGTPVDQTSVIAIEDFTWSDEDENIYRPKFANGLLLRNRGHATAVQHGTRFSFSDQPLVWEQFMHWLAMAVGNPTLDADAVDGPFNWIYGGDPSVNPNPVSFTLARRFSNGLGGTIDQVATYCMLENLTLRWAANEHLRISGAGFARKFVSTSITADLTLPETELGVSALATVYIDDLYADVGDTLLSEQVIGFEFMIGTGLMPLATAEGRTTLDFTKHQLNGNERMLSLKLTLLVDPTTYAAESAAAVAGDQRAVRVKVAGSDGRLLTIDCLMQYSKPTLMKFGEQDGQDLIEIELEEATDETNFLDIVLTHPDVFTLA